MFFNSAIDLAAALGLRLHDSEGCPASTDGLNVVDDGQAHGLAQAMLIRAGVTHDHATIASLAGRLRELIRCKS